MEKIKQGPEMFNFWGRQNLGSRGPGLGPQHSFSPGQNLGMTLSVDNTIGRFHAFGM